jgi:outer membrane protein
MKKVIFVAVMVLMGLSGYAQTENTGFKFGYLSIDSVLQSMPEYAQMQQDMATMRQQYEAEMKRVEDDFNKKYEEFLDGQKNFPKTILQKRQSELQEMLDKNIAFKKEGLQMLNDTEKTQKDVILMMIDMAVKTIGMQRGYAFILNTDANATPWLNPAMGEDITKAVKEMLKE